MKNASTPPWDPYLRSTMVEDLTALHLRRAAALINAGKLAFARLYLVLLELGYQKGAAIWRQNSRAVDAEKRAVDDENAAALFELKLRGTGFLTPIAESLGAGLAMALAAVAPLPLNTFENDRLGAVIATAWKHVANPYWPAIESHGFAVEVVSRLAGAAYVEVHILFPDAGRTQFNLSRLCSTHAEALDYAGRIAALGEALMDVEVAFNAALLPVAGQGAQPAIPGVL